MSLENNRSTNQSDREEEHQLAIQAMNGDRKARETLILNHLSLVRRILSSYRGKGTPDDVLFQEGCYGLILAVDHYDPDKGASLSTYATYYIKKYMAKATADNYPHPIIFKEKSSAKAKLYGQALETLTEQLQRAPSNREVADYLGISYQEAISLMSGVLQVIPLDSEDNADRPPAQICSRAAEEDVITLLNEMNLDDFPVPLTKREQAILYLRFGFGESNRPHTFLEISKILGLSDYTASRLCNEAIEKLRSVKNKKDF